MAAQTWKIGELARLTGLSIRTLHYYEEIGLFGAAGRSEGGHRLYAEADLERLQRIMSLRQLGFALEDVKACLDRPEYAVGPLIDLHLARLEEEIALKRRIHRRLTNLRRRVGPDGSMPVTHLLEALEATAMLENHLSPAHVDAVHAIHDPAQNARKEEIQGRWKALHAAVRAHMHAGDDPTAPPMLALARDWRELVHVSTSGDPEFARSVRKMYDESPEARQRVGMEPELWAYASRALAVEAGDDGW